MDIRTATQDDDLPSIWREVYGADYAPLLPSGVQLAFEPRGQAYVAEIEGLVVGFSYVDQEWLDELWIGKRHQSHGIGAALVSHAETTIYQAGIKRAKLSVLQNNVNAIRLYRRLGWIESHAFQDRQSGVWNLLMLKQLSN